MTHVAIPASAVPLVAALAPGVVAGVALLCRRMAVERLAQRSARKRFSTQMTIRAMHTAPLAPATAAPAPAPAGDAFPPVGHGLLRGPATPPGTPVEGAA
jgi:hypothetical protein